MKCKACELPFEGTGRFCSPKCRRQFEGAGIAPAGPRIISTPASDFNKPMEDLPPLSPAELERALLKFSGPFTARYHGRCQECGGPITPGQEIRYWASKLEHVEKCSRSRTA